MHTHMHMFKHKIINLNHPGVLTLYGLVQDFLPFFKFSCQPSEITLVANNTEYY